MKFIPRMIAPQLLRASRHFSAVILTGPRRSGKTTLLRKLFPQAFSSNSKRGDFAAESTVQV
jgi:hypothetical protein